MIEETRSKTREKVVFAIYDTIFYVRNNIDYDPKGILGSVFSCDYDDVEVFAREIYIKSLINMDEIVTLIQPNLHNWEFKRLNNLAQAILISAISEASYAKLSEKPIVIDASVKMAKKYLDEKDYRYINAVLDKVIPNESK